MKSWLASGFDSKLSTDSGLFVVLFLFEAPSLALPLKSRFTTRSVTEKSRSYSDLKKGAPIIAVICWLTITGSIFCCVLFTFCPFSLSFFMISSLTQLGESYRAFLALYLWPVVFFPYLKGWYSSSFQPWHLLHLIPLLHPPISSDLRVRALFQLWQGSGS